MLNLRSQKIVSRLICPALLIFSEKAGMYRKKIFHSLNVLNIFCTPLTHFCSEYIIMRVQTIVVIWLSCIRKSALSVHPIGVCKGRADLTAIRVCNLNIYLSLVYRSIVLSVRERESAARFARIRCEVANKEKALSHRRGRELFSRK